MKRLLLVLFSMLLLKVLTAQVHKNLVFENRNSPSFKKIYKLPQNVFLFHKTGVKEPVFLMDVYGDTLIVYNQIANEKHFINVNEIRKIRINKRSNYVRDVIIGYVYSLSFLSALGGALEANSVTPNKNAVPILFFASGFIFSINTVAYGITNNSFKTKKYLLTAK